MATIVYDRHEEHLDVLTIGTAKGGARVVVLQLWAPLEAASVNYISVLKKDVPALIEALKAQSTEDA